MHTSLSVTDLDAALGFYRAAFGFEVLFAEELADEIEGMTGVAGMRCRLAQLRQPGSGHVFELIQFAPPDGAAGVPPTAVGHGHIAFRVPDVDAALARVTALGAEPLGSPVGFTEGRAVYLREPAGSVFELSEIDPDAVA